MMPVYVTDVRPRKPEWPTRHIDLPFDLPPLGLFGREYSEWLGKNELMIN